MGLKKVYHFKPDHTAVKQARLWHRLQARSMPCSSNRGQLVQGCGAPGTQYRKQDAQMCVGYKCQLHVFAATDDALLFSGLAGLVAAWITASFNQAGWLLAMKRAWTVPDGFKTV